MAFLQFDEASTRYRIRFYYGGQEFKRSIKTKDRKTALGVQGESKKQSACLSREDWNCRSMPTPQPSSFRMARGPKKRSFKSRSLWAT